MNVMAVRAALVAAVFLIVFFPRHLAAIENARELVAYCEAAEQGVTGSGHEVEIPATREAVQCWATWKPSRICQHWWIRTARDFWVPALPSKARCSTSCIRSSPTRAHIEP